MKNLNFIELLKETQAKVKGYRKVYWMNSLPYFGLPTVLMVAVLLSFFPGLKASNADFNNFLSIAILCAALLLIPYYIGFTKLMNLTMSHLTGKNEITRPSHLNYQLLIKLFVIIGLFIAGYYLTYTAYLYALGHDFANVYLISVIESLLISFFGWFCLIAFVCMYYFNTPFRKTLVFSLACLLQNIKFFFCYYILFLLIGLVMPMMAEFMITMPVALLFIIVLAPYIALLKFNIMHHLLFQKNITE